jgi:hypothetical protein
MIAPVYKALQKEKIEFTTEHGRLSKKKIDSTHKRRRERVTDVVVNTLIGR